MGKRACGAEYVRAQASSLHEFEIDHRADFRASQEQGLSYRKERCIPSPFRLEPFFRFRAMCVGDDEVILESAPLSGARALVTSSGESGYRKRFARFAGGDILPRRRSIVKSMDVPDGTGKQLPGRQPSSRVSFLVRRTDGRTAGRASFVASSHVRLLGGRTKQPCGSERLSRRRFRHEPSSTLRLLAAGGNCNVDAAQRSLLFLITVTKTRHVFS